MKNKKKNVLIIGHTNKMGGVETFIYNTTVSSDKEKVNFDFMIHGYDKCVFEEEINNFYSGEKHIFFLPKYKKNPIKCIKKLWDFYKKNKDKYDIIHLQTGSTAEILYLYPFVKSTKAKVIVHSHNGNGSSPIINSLFRPIVNMAVDKRLACSDIASEWLFGSNQKGNVEIINNGIDTNRFRFSAESRKEIRNQYGIDDNTFVIGHIGRFSEQKNHEFIIEIFSAITKINSNSKLILIGVGELEEKIRRKVSELGIGDKIVFAGRKDNTEKYYSAFDVFLMPSLYEGLPIVGIEAQASGVPCLFSDSISHQLKLSDNAIFYSLNNSATEWAKKVLDSQSEIGNRKNYADIIKKNKFDIYDTVKRLEEIYLEM